MKRKGKKVRMQRQSHYQLFYFLIIAIAFGFVITYLYTASKAAEVGAPTLKLGTYLPDIPPTDTPMPTDEPIPPTASPIPTDAPFPTIDYSGPTLTPAPYAKQYCVDEEPGTVTVESCDDATRCDIAHGAGGPMGTCGTVIGWEHTIIEFLLGTTSRYFNRLSDNLSIPIPSSCHTAAPYRPYISTFNVIDTYNLAGFHEFSRGAHASASTLNSAWRTTSGYTSTSSANGLTPGDVVMFSNPPHIGIVNTVEIDTRGNGDIWFLHTGAAYYLGKLMTANWTVVASSTGDTQVTFGSHGSKVPDDTHGETVCYCGSVCYLWRFKPL